MKSISRQLALVSVLLVGLSLLAAGVGLYLGVRSMMLAQFDRALEANARSLATLVKWDEDGIEFEFADEMMPQFQPGPQAEYFQIVIDGHGELERSRSLGEQNLERPDTEGLGASTWNLPLPNGRAGRAVSLTFEVHEDLEYEEEHHDEPAAIPSAEPRRGRIIVAVSREPLDRALAVLAGGLGIVGAALALMIPLAVVAAVRWGLRPLRRMNAQVEGIDEHCLDARLDIEGMPAELRASVDRINALLGRLAEAFAREKRFAADAAHELRTPLAEMKTVAEVALRGDRPSDDMRDALAEIVGAATDLESLVAGLLQIARGNGPSGREHLETVGIGGLVQEIVERHEREAKTRDIRVHVKAGPDCQLRVEKSALTSIIDNLVSNAVRHSPPGSTTEIELNTDEDGVILKIRNPAPNLEAQDIAHLFEPLWRRDTSRSTGGAGLGLAIVKTLADHINAIVEASLDPEKRLLAIRLRVRSASA